MRIRKAVRDLITTEIGTDSRDEIKELKKLLGDIS